MTGKANLAASVLARLLNRAKQTGDDYLTLLSSYCIERFLFRLGASNLGNRFLLKGAMLLHVWTDQTYRATRDLDLLRRGEGNIEAIGDDIRAIIVTSVPPDAVDFDGSRIIIHKNGQGVNLNLQLVIAHHDFADNHDNIVQLGFGIGPDPGFNERCCILSAGLP